MTIDWNKEAGSLRHEVSHHGGFLTISKDALRERFGIGALKLNNSEELRRTLEAHGMIVIPHPHDAGPALRLYDAESFLGKIALAVTYPEEVPETALIDAAHLHEREAAGKQRKSDSVPWLSALDVFLQLLIGRPPEAWEDLDDDREQYHLVAALAATLELPAGIAEARETARLAGAVCACRPRGPRWEDAPPDLAATLAEAARKHKDIFEGVLREAAKRLMGGVEIPSRDVDLGRLGLRYRREAQGGVGWLR